MGNPIPRASIPFLSSGNVGWLLTLIVVGVVVGSLATLVFRTGLIRSVILCVVLTIVTAIILDTAGINLPFESWARDFVNDAVSAVSRLFSDVTGR